MNNIVSKQSKDGQHNRYIAYKVNYLNNNDSIVEIYSDLISRGIMVKYILVGVYSDDEITETKNIVYSTIDEYLNDYGKKITDFSIEDIMFYCKYNNFAFSMVINASLKKIFIILDGNKNDINLDDTIEKIFVTRK